MSSECCGGCAAASETASPAYRRVLIVALAVNAAMFLTEMGAGLVTGSVSLQADGLDFLGDSANYAISLFVLGMGLSARARAATLKGATMGVFGLWVAGSVIWHAFAGAAPEPLTMGAVGIAALFANGLVLALLFAYREGDSNMRSVWICSRNDVLGNFAVLAAALGVFGTGTLWPDLVVGAVMAALGLQGAWTIMVQAAAERRQTSTLASAAR